MTKPVAGAYRVTQVGFPVSQEARWEPHRLKGVVSSPEVEPTAVELWCQVPHKRWPRSGDVLQVFVDRADPTRIRVRWERVQKRDWLKDARNYSSREHMSAERLAAEMRKWRR
jgi:hypothetical protein